MNFNYLYRRLLFIFILFLGTSCHQNSLSRKGETVYKTNKQNWEKEIDLKGGEVFWSKTNISILESPIEFQTFGLDLSNTFGEFEIFWDGVLIGKNGNPGKESKSNLNGEMWRAYKIPIHLSQKGEHQLMLKRSLFHAPEYYGLNVFVNDYDYLLEFPLVYTAFMYIFAGGFLLASLYFFFLFLGNKSEKPILIFSISCFLFFALILIEFIRTYISIHYSQHQIRMEVISYLTFFIAILVPVYFSLQFPFPKRKIILVIYSTFLTYVFYRNHLSYDETSYNMALTMWFFSFAIAMYAVYKKHKGSFIVLLALLVCAFINNIAYFDTSLFAGFGVIVLGMLYMLSIKAKEQRLTYEDSLVQSTRLKLELLKKSIQPHFLMNTLTSLIDWVEEAPEKGVLFIEALAEEFDVLNQVENETLIPIAQEIKLCKSHISIMKFRKEIDYIWEDEGINENIEQLIPPAVIHTLLENSITHCLPSDENQLRFKLIVFTSKKTQEYTFLTFGTIRNQQKSTSDGTGFKYIKARLIESYGEDWTFTSEATNEGWKNTIKIQK
jgi:sensor histidine kinase YesM